MKKCCIIAGGDLHASDRIADYDLLICADAGFRHAKRLGLHPDVLIGDFDSFTEPLPADCEIIRFPEKKDETDTMLAVYCGRDRGYTEFEIYGALGGGRLEHTIANIQMLHHMALQGLHGSLISGPTHVTVQLPGICTYPAKEGYFSLFSLTDECTGITMKGTEYPLSDAVLKNTFPLGVSNRIVDDCAEVTLKNGVLLVIQGKDAPIL